MPLPVGGTWPPHHLTPIHYHYAALATRHIVSTAIEAATGG